MPRSTAPRLHFTVGPPAASGAWVEPDHPSLSRGFTVSQLAQLLPLVGIALIFWLLIIRPASKRQKALSRMQAALSVGDEVMLASGMYATIRELHDDTVSVEIAPGTTVRVARGAVGSLVSPAGGYRDDLDERPEGS